MVQSAHGSTTTPRESLRGAMCFQSLLHIRTFCLLRARPNGREVGGPTLASHRAARTRPLYPEEETNDGFQRDDSRGPFAKQARGRRVNRASGFKNDWRARRLTWPGARELWHGGIMWHCESGERPASHPAALAGSPQHEQSCLQ